MVGYVAIKGYEGYLINKQGEVLSLGYFQIKRQSELIGNYERYVKYGNSVTNCCEHIANLNSNQQKNLITLQLNTEDICVIHTAYLIGEVQLVLKAKHQHLQMVEHANKTK